MKIEAGPATVEERVAAVRAYAIEKYEQGWDLVVETMSDREIKDLIAGSKTRWGAIDMVSREIKPLIEHRKDIEATAF